MIKGKDIVLSLNGRNVAASTGCSISVTQDFIEVASPTSGRAKKVMPSKYEWSTETECLCNTMVDADTFMQWAIDGTALTMTLTDSDSGFLRRGTAYVRSAVNSGKLNGLSTVSVSLTGSGELESVVSEIQATELSDGVFMTHSSPAFLWGKLYETNVAVMFPLTISKRTTVRVVFKAASVHVDVVRGSATQLVMYVGNRATESYEQARMVVLHAGTSPHTEAITLEAGDYCFVVNDAEVDKISVGVAVNSISTLSEE